MTVEDFNQISTYDELYRIDRKENLHVFEMADVSDYDAMNEYVWNEVQNWDYGWDELGRWLKEVDDSYAWYSFGDIMPSGLIDGDATFSRIKTDMLKALEEKGFFNEEEDFQIEDFSINDLWR